LTADPADSYQGQVVGVDTNAAILDTGRSRVEAAGWTTARFLAGDALALELDGDFDAVVGRWVLQCTPDPATLLRRARDWLRPGGIVAFQEIDLSTPPRAYPAGPAWSAPTRSTLTRSRNACAPRSSPRTASRSCRPSWAPGPAPDRPADRRLQLQPP
jgi:ubiquinone/menaquinone biosynthesis C-methylase UbiE